MHVPEIIEIKEHLEALKNKQLIKAWELPYENILTRRSAAIFFLTPFDDEVSTLEKIRTELMKYENFSDRINQEKKLSNLQHRITFNKEENKNNVVAPVNEER